MWMVGWVDVLHPEIRIGPVFSALFVLVRGFVVRTVVTGTSVPRAPGADFVTSRKEERRLRVYTYVYA